MKPANIKNLLCRVGSVIAGAVFLAAPVLSTHAQDLELQVEEAGQDRVIELATDEIEVARGGEQPSGRLKQTIENRVAGASVMEDTATRVLVKLPRAYSRSLATLRTERIDLAVPDAESSPVFYLKGVPRDKWSRRFGTKSVLVFLNPGQTSEQVRQASGAASVRETSVQGVVVLKFPTAFHAVEATKRLAGQGIQNRPLLRQYMQKMAALPRDQFFLEHWHLINTGQRNGVAGIDINVLPAWDFGLGNGVTIAIVDDCLQTLHPDLTENCPPVATKLHHDFNDGDDDPKPIVANGDFHGTSVAGLAAARQNNGSPDPITGSLLGVSGVAPAARLLGLRLIAGAFGDEDVADALTWAPGNTIVHVSNNSWGLPEVYGLGGFDVLAKAAQRDAAITGRDGKGQVTVFSAGNGRFSSGNANYSSISNSRYILTVAALDSTGKFSSYSTPGAPVLVTAPGGGLGFFGAEQRCVSTDVTGIGGFNPGAGDLPNTDYTRQMNGTSAAAPITSGIVALMLEANPSLTWRDVKEILAGTASRIDGTSPDWKIRPSPLQTGDAQFYNGGGFKFNHDYGSGLVDAFAAVTRARTWRNLGPEVSQTLSRKEPGTGTVIPDDGVTMLTREFDFSGVNFPNLRLEQIEVELLITHRHRSDLDITLVSPSGVRSVLAKQRPRPAPGSINTDTDYRDIVIDFTTGVLTPRSGGWVFSSTHHWGENSTGKWTVETRDLLGGDTQGRLVSAAIRLYGTASGDQRVMFDKQIYSINEPTEVLLGGTYSQTGSVITVIAGGHQLAVGQQVHLDFTTGTPTPPLDSLFTVVSTTPDTIDAPGTFTVAAPDSVSRTGSVVIRSGTYSQTGNEITVTANGHNVAAGSGVYLDFTSGVPSSAVDGMFTVVASTPGVSFTVAAPDSVARTGNVDVLPAFNQPITLRRLGSTTGGFTVDYQTTFGTTTPGRDSLLSSGTVAFIDGQTTADIQIPILGDNDSEATESVQVVLTNLQGSQVAFGGNTLARINILDDEVNRVKVEATDEVASETPTEALPDPGVFTLTRSKVTSQPLDVFFTLGGTAIPGTGADGDYNPLPNNAGIYVATIPAFESSVTVTIQPREDTATEGTENVLLTIRPSLGYEPGIPASAEVRIIDNNRPRVQMALLDNLAAETPAQPAPNNARFLIKRNVASIRSLIVFLDYRGTQILGVNYLLTYLGPDGQLRTLAETGQTVEIGPNQTDVEVTVVPLNDDIYQATKSVDISIQPNPDYGFSFGFLTSVHLNITEDDPSPDTNNPVAKIKTPKTNTTIETLEPIRFFGRATDNVNVVRVLYRLNGGEWLLLPITTGPSVTWDFILEYIIRQGVVTKGSPTITGLSDISKVVIGMPVNGDGIPPGAIVTSKSANTVTIDKLATATATTEVRLSYIALGENTLEAMAIDDDGNRAKIASVFFNYIQLRALAVNVSGSGKVTKGFAPSSLRAANLPVTIKATPTPGNVFNSWTGNAIVLDRRNVFDRTLSIVMPNFDIALTANFVPSPFVPQLVGNYSGLIRTTPASSFAFETSGYLNATVTPTGAFSGKLILAGVKYPLLGEFTGSGKYRTLLSQTNDFPLTLELNIDVDPNGKQHITGTVSSNTFTAGIVANRAAFSKANPPPGAGKYTLVLPQAIPIADAQRDPRGNGVGTLTIKPNGKVHWEGTLPDGTKVVQDERLARDNTWPLFLRLYQKKGVLLGLATVNAAQPQSDLSGAFDWFKPVVGADSHFPLGFRILDADFIGSLYTAPAPGTRALAGFTDTVNNGRVTLQEGSLLADIVKTITFDPANRIAISNPGADGLALAVDAFTGAISGSFIHPVSGLPTPIEGVLFQKQKIGAGRYQGSSVPGVNPQTGRVLIEATP